MWSWLWMNDPVLLVTTELNAQVFTYIPVCFCFLLLKEEPFEGTKVRIKCTFNPFKPSKVDRSRRVRTWGVFFFFVLLCF